MQRSDNCYKSNERMHSYIPKLSMQSFFRPSLFQPRVALNELEASDLILCSSSGFEFANFIECNVGLTFVCGAVRRRFENRYLGKVLFQSTANNSNIPTIMVSSGSQVCRLNSVYI